MVDVRPDVFLGEKKIHALNKLHNLIILTRSDTDGKAYGLELSFHPPFQKNVYQTLSFVDSKSYDLIILPTNG